MSMGDRRTLDRTAVGRGASGLGDGGSEPSTRGSTCSVTLRSTKKAAKGIVPDSSTHSSLPNDHLALEPRSKAKIR